MPPRLFISAAHKSSGKTTLTIGLAAALAARGLDVRCFKKGPDYIDPLWHAAAAGRPCRNLDFHTQPPADIRALFARVGAGADVALIEGNKGLYDGVDLEGSDCSAALARLVDAPVVLVVDCAGMTRGIAPLLAGYRAFDPELRLGGVILNKVSGPRHERKLREAVAHYVGLPVLGAVHRQPALEIVERHLGLIPSVEAAGSDAVIAAIRDAVAAQVDLDALLALAASAGPFAEPPPAALAHRTPDLRIGVARDAAFAFYYEDDFEALRAAGAAIVFFSPLADPGLPPGLDGLFLGGGFPETHMAALEANQSMRADLREAVAAGMPIHAECGGMMYLSRSITWKGERRAMVGALAADTVMHERPQGRGYVRLRETAAFPWPALTGDPGVVPAHEFHYSALEDTDPGLPHAYDVLRGAGLGGGRDGLVVGRTLATYAHLRNVGGNRWAERFVAFARDARA
ncbi:MAG: cobyrinate a,c-diamide synthase [Alphaproteobacteria bacterium]|nr:cobyrinate a,c-diamide synthase [Alphaproteobacteria bacterium]